MKEKGANEIVFKAMGRAINKTVMIVELIKVCFLYEFSFCSPSIFYTIVVHLISNMRGFCPLSVKVRRK